MTGATRDGDAGVGQAFEGGLQGGGVGMGDLQPGEADAVVAQGFRGVKVALPLDQRGVAVVEGELAGRGNGEAPAVIAARKVRALSDGRSVR